MPQGLRFGICTDQNMSWDLTVERWRLFEDLGFESIWDCDHYVQPSNPTGPYHEGWTLPAFAVADRADVAKPLALNYAFAQPAEEAAAPATLYLSPLAAFGAGQNPFRHEQRTFAVDFGAPQEEMLVLTLTLPAGYELAELPKPAVVDLPGGTGRFVYSATAPAPGTVRLSSRLSLREAVYPAGQYANLRELYRHVLAKQAEQLIIRRKS